MKDSPFSPFSKRKCHLGSAPSTLTAPKSLTLLRVGKLLTSHRPFNATTYRLNQFLIDRHEASSSYSNALPRMLNSFVMSGRSFTIHPVCSIRLPLSTGTRIGFLDLRIRGFEEYAELRVRCRKHSMRAFIRDFYDCRGHSSFGTRHSFRLLSLNYRGKLRLLVPIEIETVCR